MRQKLVDVNNELKRKVSQLTQVTNMKKMIQDKNGLINDLKEKLGKYESVDNGEQ